MLLSEAESLMAWVSAEFCPNRGSYLPRIIVKWPLNRIGIKKSRAAQPKNAGRTQPTSQA